MPTFGVPEALLSDRGTNLLSHLMQDVCRILGVKKLNTTAYRPQCDGMVERFNRTLKTILRKHADKFGRQWDKYLPGILWAYRNTPHESTKEKPSFLLFGFDCRSPTEAAFLPPTSLQLIDVEDYRQELVLSLSSARELAGRNSQEAQRKYKVQYDKTADSKDYRVGDWVFVHSPQDETGSLRKLSRRWYGPFWILTVEDPDVVLTKVFFPQDDQIRGHQTRRVQPYSSQLPVGFYWYGPKRCGPGRPPKWVDRLPCPTRRNPRTGTQNKKQTPSSTPSQEPYTKPSPSRYPLRSKVRARDAFQGGVTRLTRHLRPTGATAWSSQF